MSPDNNGITPRDTPVAPTQPSTGTSPDQAATQAAAANVVRAQIEHIYDNPGQEQPTTKLAVESTQDINPYDRTHEDNPQPILEQWKQYHSAWQTYYQKYYEGYYTHHLTKAQQSLQPSPIPISTHREAVFTHQPEEPELATLSKDEALFDLRQKLLARVGESAKKVRKSRHFVPIAAGALVVLFFVFLQYNSFLIANVMAYVSPGNIDPQNIVLDPSTDINVPPQPLLIIPKINVNVPVNYGVGNDYDSQMAAMADGVAQFAIPGADSVPGQIGNTVLAGHSSSGLLSNGNYKFIFVQLDRLDVGDSIYLNYQSKRYTYTVTKKDVVSPTDVSKLVYPTTKPILTLVTCTPIGTANSRLLVTAEQVSPDPTAATATPANHSAKAATSIPGTTQTPLQQIFGGGN
jgi:sortase A